MSCFLPLSLLLLVELACLVATIQVTAPAEGETYSLNPRSSSIQWEQQAGDPAECDIWLRKEEGEQMTYYYFAHVSVPACQLDFSAWPASLMNESRSLIPGEYCFAFVTTAASAKEGTFLAQSADFVIQDEERSKDLSTGAQVGIGVGVGVGGLAILCLCGYYYMVVRRKRHTQRSRQEAYSKPELEGDHHHHHHHQVANFSRPFSPSAAAKAELSSTTTTTEKGVLSELASTEAMIHELPGSTRQPHEAGTGTRTDAGTNTRTDDGSGTVVGSSDRNRVS
ncbi:hypothetical protein AYO21_00970 [Fonsecaea monophora]|uniref:Fibronectin type-III domain-containing protein n=1 Tax=Fonsecaea monophora TaxID=254056 RepID=A0A177FL52_9EURO|nr:hypothetical protein AYO21_00970 [Fonsecaea monophora]OAG45008.1 hypothetical protein AYO21_00970 [Fonsecaea monophora]